MKRLFLTLLVALTLAVGATACGPDDGTGGSGAPMVEDGGVDPGQQ